MKAIGLSQHLPIDQPDSLLDLDLPKPVAQGRDLLVAIKAVAVNPVDTKVRAAKAQVGESPRILGWDASGTVEAVGPQVTLFQPGDEVYYAGDITRPGCNAQYQLVDERIVGPKPKTLSFAEAAALPLTTITAWEAFFDRLGINRDGANQGETLLIIGGAGGVGSIGIQLAKLAGLTVIATASRPESICWVKELGADDVINHRESLQPQMQALDYTWADYIAIFNDTDQHWPAVTELIKPQGKIVSIVENQQPLAQSQMKMKAATFVWEFMFTRAMFQTADMIAQHKLLTAVAAEIDQGRLHTTLAETMQPINAENLKRAHALLESGKTKGKIVLEGF